MAHRLRTHLNFATVASALALFIALGGSAYAVGLGKNDVKSRNIAPKAVKKGDLHKNAVTQRKVADNAIGSAEVAPESLTTADIDESKLDASIQRAITALCQAGEAITAINPQGQAACQPTGTAPATAQQLLDLIKTVDGVGSGLDADLLQGLGPGAFFSSSAGAALQTQLNALQNQVDAMQGQVDSLLDAIDGADDILGNSDDLSAQVAALCGSIRTGINSNFVAQDNVTLTVLGLPGLTVPLPNITTPLPACP
jgi:hypothetical protein